ncbi:MAG TPA: transglycosylase domain-containing protein [Candidatus Dormibacteraeota bacterium]
MPRFAHRGWAAGLAAVLVCAGFLGYVGYTLRQLPAPGEEVAARSIVVYDRTGQVLAERNPKGEYHVPLTLSQMGKYGPAATLAAEDRGFYQHGAIDPLAMTRAAAADLLSGSTAQGGSTITQQLVKIQLLAPQKTVDRKVQEMLLAWALEHRYSKDQILEMYLNRVFYGHGAYGLGAAAKAYFGKDASAAELTPAQAALLAGLIQAPNGYDPQVHFNLARERQLYVLHGMLATGVLNSSEEQKAEAEPVDKELRFDAGYRQEKAPHFVDYVIARLEQQFGSAAIQQGGLAVYTTLDPTLQALAEKAVVDGVHALAGKGVNNGDLLAVRPGTGEILAWVGSAGYGNSAIGGQYDVVLSPRQPGSSFKPYTYEAALKDHKIALCTTLQDQPTNFNGYQPLDFDNRYMGSLSARRALVLSRNIPAVEVGRTEGMDGVVKLAAEMGVHSPLEPTLPTAIGASEVTMLEHVQGYQVFANQGAKVPLVGITRITDGSGSLIFEQKPGSQAGRQQVLSPAEAYLITDTLKDYPKQWGLGWNRPFAGKSGTSGGSQVGVHPDSWMLAYSPDLVVGAWAGNTGENGRGQPTSAFGTDVGSTISAEFLNGLPRDYGHWYNQPSGLVKGPSGELLLPGTESLCKGAANGQGEGDEQGESGGGPPPKKK